MSHTHALHLVKKRDAISLWVLLGWLAFALLPSWSLDYGLLESTGEEILAAYGWSHRNISWLWCLLPSLLLLRPYAAAGREQRRRHAFDAGWALLCMAFIVVSATVAGRGLGYATLVQLTALGAIMTLALPRLDWLGGDRFVIGALVTIVALIGVFIVWPSIAIFIPMFTDQTGAFAPLAFMNVLSQAHIIQVILNSIALSIAVGAGCTFFGLVLAIYTTRIARRSAIIGRIFSILPIVTPPFVVGLGVTLMMGRSGYVTEWMVAWFGLTNTNWLYGFTGIWLAQVLAFTPMAFMILDGAIKTIHPSLEEASYTLRASRWQTFNGVFVPLLKPALANAFLIVVVQSLADFSNPLVLGGNFDVLATQIYFYITGSQLDYQAASTLGAFLLLFSLLVFCIQYMWIGKRSYVTVSGKSYRGDVQPLLAAIDRLSDALQGELTHRPRVPRKLAGFLPVDETVHLLDADPGARGLEGQDRPAGHGRQPLAPVGGRVPRQGRDERPLLLRRLPDRGRAARQHRAALPARDAGVGREAHALPGEAGGGRPPLRPPARRLGSARADLILVRISPSAPPAPSPPRRARGTPTRRARQQIRAELRGGNGSWFTSLAMPNWCSEAQDPFKYRQSRRRRSRIRDSYSLLRRLRRSRRAHPHDVDKMRALVASTRHPWPDRRPAQENSWSGGSPAEHDDAAGG